MSSTNHRQVILEALNRHDAPIHITPEKLVALIRPMLAAPSLTFTDANLSPEGPGHNKSLHITVQTLGKRIPMVLVDNGSALNVCPLQTVHALAILLHDLRGSSQSNLAIARLPLLFYICKTTSFYIKHNNLI